MTYATVSRPRPHSLHGLGCGCSAPMAGLGEMATPDFIFWTPERITSWLDQVSSQVNSAVRDVASSQPTLRSSEEGRRYLADWDNFKGGWFRFYSGTGGGLSFSELLRRRSPQIFDATLTRLNPSSISSIQTWINRYNALEQRYAAIIGRGFTSSFVPSADEHVTPLERANWMAMAWATIGIVGVVGLGYLLSNYAKIQTIPKLALNRRRRRRSRR